MGVLVRSLRRSMLPNALLAAGLMVTPITLPSTGTVASSCERQEVRTDAAVNQLLVSLYRSGASDTAIDRALWTTFCLERVTPRASTALAASSNQDINIDQPTIYHDYIEHTYLARGHWIWNKTSYTSEISDASVWRNVGKDDAFALSFSNSLYMLTNGDMTVFDRSASCYDMGSLSVGTPSELNSYGVGFTYQDVGSDAPPSCQVNLRGHEGSMVISLKSNSGCKSIQAFAKYSHTWSSTDVTGISIGQSSIGFSWSSSSYRWSAAGQGSTLTTVCTT